MDDSQIPFPVFPEIIENVVKHLKSSELWSLRLISRVWDIEILSLLDKRATIINWAGPVCSGYDKNYVYTYTKRPVPAGLISFLELATKYHPILLRRAVIIAEEIYQMIPYLKKYGHFIELLAIRSWSIRNTSHIFPSFPLECGNLTNHIVQILKVYCPNMTAIELLFHESLLDNEYYNKNSFIGVITRLKSIKFDGDVGSTKLGLDLMTASPQMERLIFPTYAEEDSSLRIVDRFELFRTFYAYPLDAIQVVPTLAAPIAQNLKTLMWDHMATVYFQRNCNFLGFLCEWDFRRLESLYLGHISHKHENGVGLDTLLQKVKDTLVVLGLNGFFIHDRAVNDPYCDKPGSPIYPLKVCFPRMPNLPFLRNVLITCSYESAYGLDIYNFVRNAPVLEDLEVKLISYTSVEFYFDPKDSLINSPHLKLRRLCIQGVVRTPLELEHIFKSFPNITDLSFSPLRGCYFEVNGAKPEIITLAEAVDEMRTLTKLTRLEVVVSKLRYDEEEWMMIFRNLRNISGLDALYVYARENKFAGGYEYFNKSLKKVWPKITNLCWNKLITDPDVMFNCPPDPSNILDQSDYKNIVKSVRSRLGDKFGHEKPERPYLFHNWVSTFYEHYSLP